MKKIRHDRKLGRILIKLADEDSWKACLHILLDRDKKLKDNQRLSSISHDHVVECQEQKKESYHKLAWLCAVTDHGDGLVHLAAFAACDVTMPLEERRFALECLNEIIKADFSCVNRIAGDGGSPLHSALSAASSSLVDGQDENFHGDNESSESDSYEDDSSETDEESNCTAIKLTKNDIAKLESHVSIDDCKFSSYSNEELVLKAIYLLLENSTDPNLPLANIHQISDYNNETQDEEVELAYSREAVMEQWTPLIFSILWLALAASSSHTNNPPKQAFTHYHSLALPLLVLNLLLQYGANPAYSMGGAINVDWTCFEFFISCSYHLKQATLTDHVISSLRELLSKTQINLDPFLLFDTGSSLYTMTWKLLESTTDEYKIKDNIKPIQTFAVAVLADDKRMIENVLTTFNIQQELLNTWCHTPIGNIIPTSNTLWSFQSGTHSTAKIHRMTLLEIMAYCLAIESVDFIMIQKSLQTNWTQLKNATRALFMNSTFMDMDDITSSSTIQKRLYTQQKAILTTFMKALDHYLEMSIHSKAKKVSQDHVFEQSHQSFLDILLLESCSQHWGLPHALPMLLEFGADPKVSSISNSIENTLLPLHFVCSNIRGHDGITIVEYLLMPGNAGTSGKPSSSASNAFIDYSYLYERATFEHKHCRPIEISLEKRNFRLSEYLWELEQHSLKNHQMIENTKELWCCTDQCYTLCEAAIERKNIQMFQFAMENMTKIGKDLIRTKDDQSDNLAKKFGKLLLWIVDERSGFGRSSENDKLICAVELIDQVRTELQLWKIPALARDEISGNSPLHLLLRQDRGISLRKRLLPCLCKMMEEYDRSQIIMNSNATHINEQAVKEETDDSVDDRHSFRNNLVSLPCSPKFGGYTALHLAVSLGCMYSIKILLQFKAYVDAKDSGGKQPVDHNIQSHEKELANDISQLLLSL